MKKLRRLVSVGSAIVGLLGGLVVTAPSVMAAPRAASNLIRPQVVAPTPNVGTFSGLTPARLLDTRSANATVDGVSSGGGPVAAGSVTKVPVLGRGGVPASGVSSVVLNVTVVDGRGPGFVTVWPSGENRPNASNVNFVSGQTIPNSVIAKVGSDGSISIFASEGAHLLVDVSGWFAAAVGFAGLSPARIFDSRSANATVDGASSGGGVLGANSETRLPVLGRGGVPSTGVDSVVFNVTAVDARGVGYVSVWPTGEARPNASNLNFVSGQTIANLVIGKIGADGSISIFTSGSAHVIVDVAGWFAPNSGFTGLTPFRFFDTRQLGPNPVEAKTERRLFLPGRGGIPASGAGSVVLNVTVVDASGPGFVSVFSDGVVRPNASNLNFVGGQTIANLVVAKLSADGFVTIYTEAPVHLLVDIAGWFSLGMNERDPGTIVIPESEREFAPSTQALTMKYKGVAGVQVGTLIATAGSLASPYDPLYARVDSVTSAPRSNVKILTLFPVKLSEIFPNFDVNLTADVESGSLLSVTGLRIDGTLGLPSLPKSATVSMPCKNLHGAVTSPVDVSVTAGPSVFSFSGKWTSTSSSILETSVLTSTKIQFARFFSERSNCDLRGFAPFPAIVSPRISLTVDSVPIVFKQSSTVHLSGSVTTQDTADVGFSTSATNRLGGRITSITEPISSFVYTHGENQTPDANVDASIATETDYSAESNGLGTLHVTNTSTSELVVAPVDSERVVVNADALTYLSVVKDDRQPWCSCSRRLPTISVWRPL